MDLRNKIPESIANETILGEYLEVCENIFNEYKEVILKHDVYKDYKNSPEGRLTLLSLQKDFLRKNILSERVTRGIIRDINQIYTTNGTRSAVEWVFKILGIRASIEYAWLIDPELYFPEIRENIFIPPRFNEEEHILQIGEGFSEASLPSVPNRVIQQDSAEVDCEGEEGQNQNGDFRQTQIESDSSWYKIGVENQTLFSDQTQTITGYLKIGTNVTISEIGVSTVDGDFPFFFDKIDYRNFVFGEAVDDQDGTFFYGRTYDSAQENVSKLRIVGEHYPEKHHISNHVVMATPYLGVTIQSLDFSSLIRSYLDNAESEFFYNEGEIIDRVSSYINYLLYDLVRPADVKVIVLAENLPLDEKMSLKGEDSLDVEREVLVEPVEITGHSISCPIPVPDDMNVVLLVAG